MSEQDQRGEDVIDIQVSIEEMDVIYQGLSYMAIEQSDHKRSIDIANDMMKVFLPVLVESNHPHYVKVAKGKSNEESS